MTQPPPPAAGPTYELRVRARLERHWSSWVDGFSITHDEDGTTTLRGTIIDQAELHGLLAKVRDLGVPLISLTSTDLGPLTCPDREERAAASGESTRRPDSGAAGPPRSGGST